MIGGADQVGVADRGEQFRAEPVSESGHGDDHVGQAVTAKPVLDRGVCLLDPRVEVDHLLREGGYQLGGHVLAGQTYGLRLRRGDGSLGNRGGVTHPGTGQQRGEPVDAGAADRLGTLVAGQQDYPTTVVGDVGGAFQRRAHRGQLLAQPVDRPGAVGDQIGAAAGEHAQLGDQIVTGSQHRQIPAHPGLIGDDPGVARVGLALTAIHPGRVVDRAAGQVPDRLVVSPQHAQQQGRLDGGQVDRPLHLPRCHSAVGDDLRDLTLVVGDLPRQQHRTVRVEQGHPMVFLTDINTGPAGLDHPCPPRRRSTSSNPGQPRRQVLKQRHIADLNQRPGKSKRAGRPVLSSRARRAGNQPNSHTRPARVVSTTY
ncbi:hypothetical protein B0E53_07076 [Micromonospora sp. MH33]|nr:hypothetical protein B0E53_07076 [Micromonospora sp. MH33]